MKNPAKWTASPNCFLQAVTSHNRWHIPQGWSFTLPGGHHRQGPSISWVFCLAFVGQIQGCWSYSCGWGNPSVFCQAENWWFNPNLLLCPSSQLQTCKSTLPLTWELPCSPHGLLQGLLSPCFPHQVGNPSKTSSLSALSAEEGDHLQLWLSGWMQVSWVASQAYNRNR